MTKYSVPVYGVKTVIVHADNEEQAKEEAMDAVDAGEMNTWASEDQLEERRGVEVDHDAR